MQTIICDRSLFNCQVNVKIIHHSYTQIRHVNNIKLIFHLHSQTHLIHILLYCKNLTLIPVINYPRNLNKAAWQLVQLHTFKYHWLVTVRTQVTHKNNQHTCNCIIYQTRFPPVVCNLIDRFIYNIYKSVDMHHQQRTNIKLLNKIR